MSKDISTQYAQRESILSNSRQIHSRLHKRNRELVDELVKSYVREKKLLRSIDSRDKRIGLIVRENSSLIKEKGMIARENITLVKEKGMIARENKSLTKEIGMVLRKNTALVSTEQDLRSELEELRKKYNALSHSKLGALQLKYWRLKTGK